MNTVITPEIADAICKRYVAGETQKDLAIELGIGKWAMRSILVRGGITIRDAQMLRATRHVNHLAFDELTPEACYWLGFIFSDGATVYPTRGGNPMLSIDIQDGDILHLEKLKLFLQSDHKICVNKRQKCTTVQLAIRSKELCRRIEELGRKGGKPNMDVSLFTDNKDFWRGMLDADGSIGVGADGSAWFHMTSHLNPIIEFKCYILRNLGIALAVRRMKSVYVASAEGSVAQKLVNYFYDGSTPVLDRKQARALEITGMVFNTRMARRTGQIDKLPEVIAALEQRATPAPLPLAEPAAKLVE